MAKTTWRQLIVAEMEAQGESGLEVVAEAFGDGSPDAEFDAGYGGSQGVPFTLWTKARVYFPVVYDGAEWVGSVSRDPDGKPTPHQGGE